MTSELEPAEQRVRIFEAILLAVDRRTELLDLVASSTSLDESLQAVSREFDLDDIQAQAVLDLQVRRFATNERAKIVEILASAREHVAHLRG
ncbi:DNA gyrase subunit A [Kribbella sp. NPDC051718]|uniref:DNA gyrase subunit A n=1 Tax=Kribbella sp. NPDC051718 TaxID=3155168 RepID=UPI0034404FAC